MIVNGSEQYNTLIERMSRDAYISTPIFRDLYKHRVINNILCVGITFLNGDFYTISISSMDAPQFLMPELIDHYNIDLIAYLTNTSIRPIQSYYTPYVQQTHNTFQNVVDCNRIIPITVWSSIIKKYHSAIIPLIHQYDETVNSAPYKFMRGAIKTLHDIEASGLAVDESKFNEWFGEKSKRYVQNGLVYSQYNPYTTTGRPSNRFGGINFSALNKSDGSRDVFVSRYENGCLVQMDFEAYHLRLIANDLQVQLPTESLHTELAKVYFETDEITDELYAASKQKTFEIMYGMTNESYNFELFEKINTMRKIYQNQTSIELPTGVVVDVQDPTSSKLFNYYMQSLEMVRTIPKLQQVLDLLKNTNNNLILYTYDSILLDMEQCDIQLLNQIVTILEENKKFPVRVYTGTTYGNITEIRL